MQIKIESTNKEMLHTACKQFLGRTQAEIEYVALETLEGHQRGILGESRVLCSYADGCVGRRVGVTWGLISRSMLHRPHPSSTLKATLFCSYLTSIELCIPLHAAGTMTVEEIFQDRTKFSDAVFKIACAVRICLECLLSPVLCAWCVAVSLLLCRFSLFSVGWASSFIPHPSSLSQDLCQMGITVVSYTIKDLSDKNGLVDLSTRPFSVCRYCLDRYNEWTILLKATS